MKSLIKLAAASVLFWAMLYGLFVLAHNGIGWPDNTRDMYVILCCLSSFICAVIILMIEDDRKKS